jgi:hypothetical protein
METNIRKRKRLTSKVRNTNFIVNESEVYLIPLL